MSGEITPRVNASYLEEFRNQPVRLVGKLTQRSDLAGIVDSSGNVQVKLNADMNFEIGHYYEFIGSVQNDLSLRVLGATDFGTDIDISLFDSLVQYSNRYHEIFYDRS